MTWGEYIGTIVNPGLYIYNPIGIDYQIISTAQFSIDLPSTTCTDLTANPIIVSGIVNAQIVHSKAAALDVEAPVQYARKCAVAVMKQVCAKYPYESKSGHSLKAEQGGIAAEMCQALQERCNCAGIRILSFNLTDLQYSPEIAQMMLVRQAAEAKLDARQTIVDGAVDIVIGAKKALDERGIDLNDDETAKMVSNLLITICAENPVIPTIIMNS